MDLLFQYTIHLSIFIASLFTILFIFAYKYNNKKSRFSDVTNNLPPGKKGWPLVGETLDFVAAGRNGEPEKFINDRTCRYASDVFKTSLLGQDVVVFCGATSNKFLLSSSANKNLKPWIPKSLEKAIYLTEDLTEFMKIVLDFLKPEPVQHYMPIMDSMTKQHLETEWLPHKQVKVHRLIKKFAFTLACRLFMDVKDPDEIAGIQNPYTAFIKGIFSAPIDFPGTPYRESLKAGKVIRERLVTIINKRRSELAESNKSSYNNLLSYLLTMSSSMAESTVSSGFIALLLSSHDTITGALTFTIKYLAENPQVYNKVLQEQKEIAKSKGPEELLNLSDLQKMKYSWCVAQESMRLSPPAQGTFREATTDLTYAGFTIPKGWKGFWTVHSTHKNSRYFKDPNKFDPSRFEGEGPAPYTYLPFGAGPHSCKGKEYSRLVMLVFMHNLVTKFELKIVIRDEKTTYTSSTTPVNELPIQIKPRVS